MDQRRLVPEPWKSQLEALREERRTYQQRFEESIVGALRAGASIRQVAKIVGLSHSRVLQIGHAHGWPPEEERERRRLEIEMRRADNARHEQMHAEYLKGRPVADIIAEYIETGRRVDDEPGPESPPA